MKKWIKTFLILLSVWTIISQNNKQTRIQENISTPTATTSTVHKGDTLTLGDYEYLVLKVENNEALVVMKSNKTTSAFGSQNYDQSTLQSLMNGYYADSVNALGVEQDAIVAKDITIGTYSWNNGTPSGSYVAKGTYGQSKGVATESIPYYITKSSSTTLTNQYVYALDVQDVVDYLGKDSLSTTNITNMFGTTLNNSDNNNTIWLRSAYTGNSSYAFYVYGRGGLLDYYGYGYTNGVRPAFVLDLSFLPEIREEIWTIEKATPTVTAPTAKTLTYNGSAQTLINAGSTTGGTLQYKLGTGSYSTSLPTATNAGTYTIYYKVVGDSNWEDVTEKSITVTIDKKSLTIPTLSNATKTYSGSSQSPTVNNYNSNTMTQGGTASASAIGDYSITWTLKDTTNYKWSDGTNTQKSANWSIGKASNPISVTATQSGSLTFSTSAQDKTFTAATGAQGSVTYAIQSQKKGSTSVTYFSIPTSSTASFRAAASTPAGTYTIVVRATAAGNSNYNSGYKDITYTLTVNKQSLTIPSLTNSSKTYNGSAQSPTVNNYASGTMTQGGTSSATAAGTYSVTWDLKDTANYVWSDGTNTQKSASWAIGKSTPTVTAPTAKTLTYNGSAQTLINAGSTTGGTIQYRLGSGSYSTSLPTATNAGTYTVYYKVVGGTNYNDVAEKSISVTIAQKEATLSWTNPTLIYNGSEQTGPTATVSNLIGSDTCTVTVTGNKATSVGDYTATATALSNSNYKLPSANTKTWKIASSEISATIKNGSATYNGSATNGGASITVTYPSSGATIKYGTTSGTYDSTSMPTFTNAGTHTVYYQITATNYTTKTGSLTITIDRASVGAKPTTSVSKTYNGSAQNNGYTTPSGVTMTGNNSGTNANTYTATYTPDSNHKWSDGTTGAVNVVLTINKATPTLTFNDETLTSTFGPANTKSITAATGNQGTLSYKISSQKQGSTSVSYFSLSGTTLSIAGNTPAGTYTISIAATDSGNSNYSSVTKTKNVTLVINALVIKFNGNGNTLGDMEDFNMTNSDDSLPSVGYFKQGYTFIGWKIE